MSALPTVLLVDDEPAVRFTLEAALEGTGVATLACASGEEALGKLAGIDAVVTDLVMPGMDGLALLAEIRKVDPDLPVVLLTARGSEKIAVAAIRQGAYDYMSKPFAVEELRVVVGRAVEARALRRSARQHEIERALGKPVLGESPAWRRLMTDVARVARRDVTALVRGETGTGKELVAGLLHALGPRRERALVRFNCAAIPGELAEAELFGHVRGAFTGATAARRGFFAQADGGTLVLDEVGELPLPLQSKLLRALQEGEIQPVGAGRVEKVDVRLVACTNRDLAAEARAGRFREDLYFRLAVVELLVPPLRERREDVPLLADAFRRRYAARFGLDDARFSPALVAALAAREWPGNVRELENAVARLLALSDGGLLDAELLSGAEEAAGPPSAAPSSSGNLRAQVAAFERALVERALAEAGGNQSEAARRLGVTRVTLIDKMKRHGITARRS
jgi:two-component system response regulator AtoC